MRFSKELLNEKYKVLPKVIKDMTGLKTAEVIQWIAKKHQLHVDTTGLLSEEITYIIFGVEKSSDFIRNLKVQLKLPDEKVNAIAKDVNEKIFLPIRESLKKVEGAPSAESGIRNQESGKQKEIHHSLLNESEEIRKQVEEQQVVKPVAPPPSNLPTGASAETKESNGETSPISEKKPIHIDPYREPID